MKWNRHDTLSVLIGAGCGNGAAMLVSAGYNGGPTATVIALIIGGMVGSNAYLSMIYGPVAGSKHDTRD